MSTEGSGATVDIQVEYLDRRWSVLWFPTCLDAIERGQEGRRAGEKSIWSGCITVLVDNTDGAPDVGLELGSSGIDLIPEVELVC